MRKLLGGVAAGVAFVVLSATPALAHSCANASRPAPTNENVGGNGNWLFIEEVGLWGMDAQQPSGSLLTESRHCTDPKETDKKNYYVAGFGPHLRGVVTGCGEPPG